jgi:hypothetical protein
MSTDPYDADEDDLCDCCLMQEDECECVTCIECEGLGTFADHEGYVQECEKCDGLGIVEG